MWLVPRLDRFRQMHPDINVSVEADVRLVEFRGHEAELAIRLGWLRDRGRGGGSAPL